MADQRLGVALVVTLAVAGVLGGAAWWIGGRSAPGGGPVASVAGAELERGAVVGEVDRLARPSLRLVEATACGVTRQGTATQVRWNGTTRLLTNRHVVAGAGDAVTIGPDGGRDDVEVEAVLSGRDAAVLGAVDAPALETGPMPAPGSPVVVVGYPHGAYRAEAGRVVAVERRHGYGGETDMLIVDVDAEPGVSGGVVLDGDGRAVGLVAARDPESSDTVAYPIGSLLVAEEPGPPPC